MRYVVLCTLTAMLSAGCASQNADKELDLARKAIADARAKKASNCAKETFVAAEQAILEASQPADDGEVDQAKAAAAKAQKLAEQAAAASPEGCDEEKVAKKEEDEPKLAESNAMNASTNVSLDDALETVYFDYNDSSIREDSKASLSRLAGVLSSGGGTKIEIEGHCDVRGSTEYNLHLGERRARSVKKYLMAQGVSASQVQIISYGEERPIDLNNNEGAHQRNRRAELKKQ